MTEFFTGCIGLFTHTFDAALEVEYFQVLTGLLLLEVTCGAVLLLYRATRRLWTTVLRGARRTCAEIFAPAAAAIPSDVRAQGRGLNNEQSEWCVTRSERNSSPLPCGWQSKRAALTALCGPNTSPSCIRRNLVGWHPWFPCSVYCSYAR